MSKWGWLPKKLIHPTTSQTDVEATTVWLRKIWFRPVSFWESTIVHHFSFLQPGRQWSIGLLVCLFQSPTPHCKWKWHQGNVATIYRIPNHQFKARTSVDPVKVRCQPLRAELLRGSLKFRNSRRPISRPIIHQANDQSTIGLMIWGVTFAESFWDPKWLILFRGVLDFKLQTKEHLSCGGICQIHYSTMKLFGLSIFAIWYFMHCRLGLIFHAIPAFWLKAFWFDHRCVFSKIMQHPMARRLLWSPLFFLPAPQLRWRRTGIEKWSVSTNRTSPRSSLLMLDRLVWRISTLLFTWLRSGLFSRDRHHCWAPIADWSQPRIVTAKEFSRCCCWSQGFRFCQTSFVATWLRKRPNEWCVEAA